jgi:hypothetical protein
MRSEDTTDNFEHLLHSMTPPVKEQCHNKDSDNSQGISLAATRTAADKNENESIAMTAPVMTETNASSESSDKIAMTAPVMTDSDPSKKTTTMSFILPSKYQSVDEIPVPNDSGVKIEVIESYTVASLRFSGRWTPEATDIQKIRLLEMLRDDRDVKLTVDEEAKVEPKIARYNPPWTLRFSGPTKS